jgi:hypothetical protein
MSRLPLQRILLLMFAVGAFVVLLLKTTTSNHQHLCETDKKVTVLRQRGNGDSELNATTFSSTRVTSENVTNMSSTESGMVDRAIFLSVNEQRAALLQNASKHVSSKGTSTSDDRPSGSNVTTVSSNVGDIYIPNDQLAEMDMYSGAWWQSIERFSLLDAATLIENLEGASFAPLTKVGHGIKDGRMTRDFLDFSIEHLSHFWKLIGEYGTAFSIGKLQVYSQRVMTSPKVSNMMTTTIAIIPHGDLRPRMMRLFDCNKCVPRRSWPRLLRDYGMGLGGSLSSGTLRPTRHWPKKPLRYCNDIVIDHPIIPPTI